MAIEYNKTNWENNVTKLNAENMNHIEDGIEAATNAINDSVTNITAGLYMTVEKNGQTYLVKVDDTALARDFIKKDKQRTSVIPQNNSGNISWIPSSVNPTADSLAQRNANGDCNFHKLNFEFIGYKDDISPSVMYYYDIYNNTKNSDYLIEKTPTNRGTLTTTQLTVLQNPNQSKNLRIVYDNQVYYRMDQQGLPQLRYIHLDLILDGNGGYKPIGKIFNVISTGDWQIINIDFGGSTPAPQATEIYRHGITMNDANIVVKLDIYDSNSQNYTYEQLKAKLTTSNSYCANARIKRSDSTYYYSPATIAYWNDSTGDFNLTYNNTEGNNINVNWTPSVVSDNGTQIL